jgi:hypothetical protein
MEVPDSFYYTVYDKYGQSADANVIITVTCPPPPVAVDQEITTSAQVDAFFKLDIQSSWPLSFETDVFPYNGEVTNYTGNYTGIPGYGKGTYFATYRPQTFYCSLDSEKDTFSYTVSDIFGQTGYGTVQMLVLCPPAPRGPDQFITVVGFKGIEVAVNLQINGTKPLLYDISVEPMNGFTKDLVMTNGTLTYVPFPDYW